VPLNFSEGQTRYASANQPKLAYSTTKTDVANLGAFGITLPKVTFVQQLVSTTRPDSNSAAALVSFSHNTVLPNPPKPLFKSQQANAYANTSQIGNPTPWDQALSRFKEKLHIKIWKQV
jgi:hypothetical protein